MAAYCVSPCPTQATKQPRNAAAKRGAVFAPAGMTRHFKKRTVRMMSKSLPLILLAAALARPAWTQDRFELSVDAIGGFPRGEFEDTLNDEGYGVNLYFGYNNGRSPWSIGLDLGFLRYGETSLDDPFGCCGFIDEIETSNNIYLGHAVARWQPRWPQFNPYLEGLLGVKRFETETSVFADDFTDAIDTDQNFSDSSVSYGLGAGFDLPLTGPAAPGRRAAIALQLGARWLWGETAEYVLEDTVGFIDAEPVFEVASSKTNMFDVRLGAAFRF